MEKETLSVRVDRRIKQRVVEMINSGVPATVTVENALYFFMRGFYEYQKKYEDCAGDIEAAFAVYINNFNPLKVVETHPDKIRQQYSQMKKYFDKKRKENGNHKEND